MSVFNKYLLTTTLAAAPLALAAQAWTPRILFFYPTSGKPGTAVTVVGFGFTGATAATLGGTPAPFTVKDNYLLNLTVPAGAATGPIGVTTPEGTATSPSPFTVTSPAPPPTPTPTAPTLAAFSPAQGPAGTVVTVTGTGFAAGAKVAFNGTPAAQVTFVSSTQLKATVPAGAATGPITVTTAAGTATSATSFTVGQAPAAPPAITGFTPTQGPAGTAVTISGTGFAAGAKVAFHGTAAQAAFVSATQLKATVPAGATSGPITVTTAAGTATSTATFTVPGTPAPTGVDISIGGWYLTQSVQKLDRSVPLVAGRDAYLRVFPVAAGANQAAPAVRVTLTGGSPSPWVQTIPAPGTSVPTQVNEGSLAASWNLPVPGAALAPGATLKLELDPAGAVPDPDRANNTVTAGLAVQAVKPLHVTLFPVTQQGLTGNVSSGRTLASWVDRLHRMYPLANLPAGIDVQQGAGYTTQADLNSGSSGWSQLLNEVERKRLAESSSRYYFGAAGVSYSGGITGIGAIGGPSAIGWDKSGYPDGGNYPEVLSHEMGHNFGRRHAPCGGAAGIDPDWPAAGAYSNAQDGAYGFDLPGRTLKPPTYKDIMSYCHPNWVSDYTYKGVLSFRAASAIGLAADPGPEPEPGAPAPAPVPCLLVSGRLRDGRLDLDPAYTVPARPALPGGDEFLLELVDADGAVLRQVPFTPLELADLPGPAVRHFAFTVPLTARQELALQSIRVVSSRGVLAVRQGGVGAPPEPPRATAAGPGAVRLAWDARNHPTAMVRDPGTGEVLGFPEGGQADLATGLTTLEVVLSNGVVSYPYTIQVAPSEGS